MKVGILYNYVDELVKGNSDDAITDNEIVETVSHVQKALQDSHEIIPLRITDELFSVLATQKELDLIFNLCEGYKGDSSLEANIASFLELIKIPFTGCSSDSLKQCQDKSKTKNILLSHNIPTPRFSICDSLNKRFKHNLSFPLIVKPSREDASVGITNESIVYNEEELRKRINYVLSIYEQPAIIEEFIDGRELNVAIIGNQYHKDVLPISEIVLSNGVKIVGFDAKWSPESFEYKNTSGVCPARLDSKLEDKLRRIAKDAFEAMECRDYGRVDFRLKGDEPFVLEVNPNPGINIDSGFFRSAQTAGMSYQTMIEKILDSAISRNKGSFSKHKKIEFEHKRVLIREVSIGDLETLVNWFNDKELGKYMDEPSANYSTQEIFEAYFKPDASRHNFVVLDKENCRRIGYCSLYNLSESHNAEISFLIGDRSFQGKGLGYEIMEGLVELGEKKLNISSFNASVVELNFPSIRCLEKVGFHKVGVVKENHLFEGRYYDEFMYRMQ